MSSLLNDTIVQDFTNSNQGVNVTPKLDAKSFFFLEDNVYTQNSNQAFGVIDENQFRTTALLTVSNKKVISVCSGQVFLQPQTGSTDKVNLILKPYKQPVNGLSIKYFIYRGLPKSQFFDNDKVLEQGSEFITHINNEFSSFYSDVEEDNAPDFLSSFIGFPADNDTTQNETDLIDSYFYKISTFYQGETEEDNPEADPNKNFEFPMIPAGMELATANGEIGLDIVLNKGEYYIENDTNPFKLDLAFARAHSNILNAGLVTEEYQKRLLRENCTFFIDPAAYYGFHANGGKIYKHNQSQAIETASEIYDLITPFATKNNIYLYIQSERQHSYNFYGNYKVSDTETNNLKTGTTEANLSETTFETDKWPLKVFSIVSSESEKQTIALQFITDRNVNTSLYGVLANMLSVNQENFVSDEELIQLIEEDGTIPIFTKTVSLSSPAVNNQNVASMVRLVYLGKNIILTKPGIDDEDPESPPADPIQFTTKYMDDVFYLIDAVSCLVSEDIHHVHSHIPTLYNQQDIDTKRTMVLSYTQRTQNTIALNETETLTLFTYLSVVEKEQGSHSNFSVNISANKEATGYGVQNLKNFYTLPNLPGNEYIEQEVFTDNEETINGIKLKTKDDSLPTSLVLGLTEAENSILKTLTYGIQNAKVYFEPYYEENIEYISPENISYRKYKLGILEDNSDFSFAIGLPPELETIIVFSIDGLVFFSKEYAEDIVKKIEGVFIKFEV